MSKKIITGNSISIKDDTGAYLPSHLIAEPVNNTELLDISIDDLMNAGLQAIRGSMKAVMSDVNTGMPNRETIQNLKDLMSMLRDLKKDEKDLLNNLSDEQLESLLKNK